MSHGEVGRGEISLEGQRANDSNSWKASQEKNGRKMSKEFDGRKLSQEVNGGRKLSQDLKVGRKVSHEVLGGRKMSQDLDGMEGTEVMAVLNLPSSETFCHVVLGNKEAVSLCLIGLHQVLVREHRQKS